MGNGKTKREVIQSVKRLVEKKSARRGCQWLNSMVRVGGQDL